MLKIIQPVIEIFISNALFLQAVNHPIEAKFSSGSDNVNACVIEFD